MIELALQTKRKEDQRGNTPGVAMFEPAPTFCQIIFPGRSSLASLVPPPWSAQSTGLPEGRETYALGKVPSHRLTERLAAR